MEGTAGRMDQCSSLAPVLRSNLTAIQAVAHYHTGRAPRTQCSAHPRITMTSFMSSRGRHFTPIGRTQSPNCGHGHGKRCLGRRVTLSASVSAPLSSALCYDVHRSVLWPQLHIWKAKKCRLLLCKLILQCYFFDG